MMDVRPTQGDSSWFTQDRFGMFIHWGLYALPARHEWIRNYEQISNEDYEKYFKHFDPDLYDPNLWAAAACDAGMKYFVITTKHHEGFCLWDSALTDYKAPNTPAGRDLLTPMVEAFRSRDMRVGFYHSLIDWHHPEFMVDKLHPMRNSPDRETMNLARNQANYAKYLHGQVRELLTQFGKIDIMWFDFSYEPCENLPGKGREDWDSQNLIKMIRELQPDIILNDRLDLKDGWDIKTPEQYMPREWVKVDGRPVVWEACHTFSGAWGYHRDESSWKSEEQLIQILIDSVSKGGNLLLNVGPTGRGEFDERALSRLKSMGEWMRRHGRSIYGCTQAPAEFKTPEDCRLTYNPEKKRLYVHVFAWPFGRIYLDGFAGKVEYAQLLNDASELKMDSADKDPAQISGGNGTLAITLPVKKPNVTIPVIELFLK
ncbi:MAG: alpha-L-fucosidase [Armatimonadota bacterium]|jgi:alpha-L-fucosidase